MSRKPMTILVINNQGGAIFSLLPIADGTDPGILNQFFYTSHNISIYELCMAHGVKHLCVKTKLELQDALVMSQHEKDCVVEVESCIDDNSAFHSLLRKSASHAADHALSVLSRLPISDGFFICKITKMEYCLYRIQLCAPSTSSPINHTGDNLYREGYILSISLEDGSVGYGEVSPIEIHKENLLDVEEQLRFLVHVIQGTNISSFLPLLNGSFTSWLWNKLGIPECAIFSSVRCGLEMAILNALAITQDSSLLCILRPLTKNQEMPERPSSVRICALVDSNGTPAEVAYIATSLIEQGFTAIKFKVARWRDPVEDAAIIQEVRKMVGEQIAIRVDANRRWTYEEAIQFGTLVKGCDLQYIEEPVQDEVDIIKYSEETGLPVALDETIDILQENPLDMLAKYTHPGIVALVIKPSVIGGFEKAALIAQWAQQQGKMAVVSAAFESSLGLSTYILFSHFLELQNVDLCNVMHRKVGPSIAHGLGTYRWLKQDVTCNPLKFLHDHCSGFVGASVGDATQFLQKFQINHSSIQRNYTGEQVRRYHLTVNTNSFSCAIKVYEVGWTNHDNVVVLLHGFLGTGEDWIPIMKAISGCARCISLDLPGHGESKLWNNKGQAEAEPTLSIETISDILYRLIQVVAPGNFTIVGYSMGARIALHMALRLCDKVYC
uniref:Mandelate racemase/muconate lactonizing enzyme C-terminal domain-containing protein n=1 Tax=Rhizophora mucronata TaxID=61149 RepID=A0A2P2MWF1_RHIMU